MKKLIFPLIMLFIIAACNNNTADTKKPKTQADSLMDDVMAGHDVGMAKYSKLSAMQQEVKKVLDSIAKLPAKAQQVAAPLKVKLDSLASDLNYALFAMDKWMEEFNMDSAVNNMQERVKYLTNEKMKVGKIKEAMLNGLAKADSLLRSKL